MTSAKAHTADYQVINEQHDHIWPVACRSHIGAACRWAGNGQVYQRGDHHEEGHRGQFGGHGGVVVALHYVMTAERNMRACRVGRDKELELNEHLK